jgi:hypothetical protein
VSELFVRRRLTISCGYDILLPVKKEAVLCLRVMCRARRRRGSGAMGESGFTGHSMERQERGRL